MPCELLDARGDLSEEKPCQKLSASWRTKYQACRMRRPPVLNSRCCRLVSDQLRMASGDTLRRSSTVSPNVGDKKRGGEVIGCVNALDPGLVLRGIGDGMDEGSLVRHSPMRLPGGEALSVPWGSPAARRDREGCGVMRQVFMPSVTRWEYTFPS